ncbi:hypothetical protein ACI3EY_14825 [Ornithinimicrobium sp. LYQ92]|uniref:hypothetical protein n=1 Tax=Serinicoccus sp. LYQ92 TaxID=3378798 RepID=UPI0038541573
MAQSMRDRSDEQGPEVTLDDLDTEQKLQSHRVTVLKSARQLAKSWLGISSTLTALVAVVAILKGPESIADVSQVGRWGIAVVVTVAYLLLAAGTYLLYRAAYGDAGEATTIQTGSIAGLHGRYLAALEEQSVVVRRHLVRGLRLVSAGALLVLLATLTLWFPAATTPSEEKATCVDVGSERAVRLIGDSIEVDSVSEGVTIAPC